MVRTAEEVSRNSTFESRTTKDALFLGCKEKACCSWYSVTLSGADVYRIWRSTGLDPIAFCVYADARKSSDTWFALEPRGTPYQLMLAKRGTAETASRPPCVFLWRLPDGHAQCGLGDVKPGVCRTFPSLLVNGVLCTGDRAGCTCSFPMLASADRAEEIRRLRSAESEMSEYRDLLDQWNARLDAANRPWTFDEFLSWLLEAYADRSQSA